MKTYLMKNFSGGGYMQIDYQFPVIPKDHGIIYLKQPVYYWCSYWLKWDEIIGWNPANNYIVVKGLEPYFAHSYNQIRQHCTTINRFHLSTSLVDRDSYKYYEDFEKQVSTTSDAALRILHEAGVPYRLISGGR